MTANPDSLPAATPQGGETRCWCGHDRAEHWDGGRYDYDRCGVKGCSCGQFAAAPVEEGREGEAKRVWGDPAKLAAYEGHNAKCEQCANSYGADEMCQEGLELHHAWWLTLAATRSSAASRAPHEGPTSGLRELQARLDELDRTHGKPGMVAYVSPVVLANLVAAARQVVAASPLAPTSDGALLAKAVEQLRTTLGYDSDATLVDLVLGANLRLRAAASRPVVENTGETR